MTTPNLTDPRDIWNYRFKRVRRHIDRTGREEHGTYEPWLEPWLPLMIRALDTAPHALVLDLGCGSGRDSCYMADQRMRVIAVDISREALAITGRTARCRPAPGRPTF